MNPLLKTSLAAALVAGILLAAGGAQAAKFTAHVTLPLAYNQYDNIRHPGSHVTFNPGDIVMINPQPLPPRYLRGHRFGDEVSLNPQPLPPRYFARGYRQFDRFGDEVGFNPQPDPPADF